MGYIEPSRDDYRAFVTSDIEGPIHMLNLLRFKAEGGRAAYAEYARHTAPLLERVGGRVVYQAEGRAAVIGPESWDLVLIVEYPSLDKFRELTTAPDYLETVRFRTEALDDSRLVCLQASRDALADLARS